jgi:transcription elongation factor Elf1
VADPSPIYDCPKCHGVQTVVDAGDAQRVHWCSSCNAFFSGLDLKKLLRTKDGND